VAWGAGVIHQRMGPMLSLGQPGFCRGDIGQSWRKGGRQWRVGSRFPPRAGQHRGMEEGTVEEKEERHVLVAVDDGQTPDLMRKLS
jgi:hypothetical protein